MTYIENIIKHYQRNWPSKYRVRKWNKGPMNALDSEFCILEFEPNLQRKMWTYATCGMSSPTDENPIELHLFSAVQDESLIELLTLVAYYNKTEAKLGLNHTVNFGKSWQLNSDCTYGLISLPYLDGVTLEILNTNQNKQFIHCYWLIPITKAELDYKKRKGVELLEEKFDNVKFNYLDANRNSVV